jgi:hypothetical protein
MSISMWARSRWVRKYRDRFLRGKARSGASQICKKKLSWERLAQVHLSFEEGEAFRYIGY